MGVGVGGLRMLPRRNYAYENGGPGMRCQRGVCYIENVSPVKMKRILVKSSAGRYFVVSGAGAIRRAAQEIAALGRFSSVHVISSRKVWRAVGKSVQRGLQLSRGGSIHLFDDPESAKNLRSVEQITRSLCRAGADRQSLVVAVGGGVVGDVAGFAAAVFLRGVKLVHIPTTLVSQVDSSIGGKTGVNLPEGKNLVGSFYPPQLVLTDPELLRSLSDREFRGGLAEIIKHRIIALIRRLGPLPPWPRFPATAMLRAMHSDKKTRAGVLRFVLSTCIGEARSYDTVPPNIVERVLHFTPRLITASNRLSLRRHG